MPPKSTLPPKKGRRGQVKLTSEEELVRALDSEISSQQNAELAVLHLFHRYDFDLDDLRRLLLEKGLNVIFSKVKYRDIAPRVNLEPTLAGADMKTFDIHRARIPTSLFKDIVQDLEIAMYQYGEPLDHKNEEARSRFLSPLFNRTVALFKLTIRNTPESTIPSRMTTKGRVEYQFLVFGGLSLLVIEFVLGTGEERLDAIAQVIAECDACDYANDRLNFPPFPIYGILCDGTSFEFFSFDGKPSPPTFSRGVFRTPNSKPFERLVVADYSSTSDANYIRSLRPICEVLFYFLLLTYNAGVQAYMLRSADNAVKANHPPQSTPGWREAEKLATEALSYAMNAAVMATVCDPAADEETEIALNSLQQSLDAIPASYKKNLNLLSSWDEESIKFC